MVLLPPDQVDAMSDEERLDEDELDAAEPGDVSGHVEVELFDEDDEEEDDIPLIRFTREGQWKKIENLDRKMVKNFPRPLVEAHPELLDLTPIQLFSKFCDSSVRELLIRESIRYANGKNCHDFGMDEADLCAFLGIMLLSGYHTLPRQRLYWSKAEDVSVPLVGSRMSRNRFLELKQYLHCSDNASLDARMKCEKCGVTLHQKCEKAYHTKE